MKIKLDRDGNGNLQLTLNDRKTFVLQRQNGYEDDSVKGWKKYEKYGESHLYIPLPFKWCIDGVRHDKTRAELVGIPNYSFTSIISDFDEVFDTLAVGTLKYHMGHAITVCTPYKREKYGDLVRRFESVHDQTLEGVSEEDLEAYGDGNATPEQAQRVREALAERRKKREEVLLSARHDFVEIMDELWS